mgnify:CR=1 FL=1
MRDARGRCPWRAACGRDGVSERLAGGHRNVQRHIKVALDGYAAEKDAPAELHCGQQRGLMMTIDRLVRSYGQSDPIAA